MSSQTSADDVIEEKLGVKNNSTVSTSDQGKGLKDAMRSQEGQRAGQHSDCGDSFEESGSWSASISSGSTTSAASSETFSTDKQRREDKEGRSGCNSLTSDAWSQDTSPDQSCGEHSSQESSEFSEGMRKEERTTNRKNLMFVSDVKKRDEMKFEKYSDDFERFIRTGRI